MHFAAYSPLGGGFLNGNLRKDRTTGTRFTSHAAAAMSRSCIGGLDVLYTGNALTGFDRL